MQLTTDAHTINFAVKGRNVSITPYGWKNCCIFWQSISNTKYSEARPVWPHVQTGEAIFQIQDEGIGLFLTDQAQLFDLFQQAPT